MKYENYTFEEQFNKSSIQILDLQYTRICLKQYIKRRKIEYFSKKQIDLLSLVIKDVNGKKYINKLVMQSRFLFIYNSITNVKLMPGYNIKDFVAGQIIII